MQQYPSVARYHARAPGEVDALDEGHRVALSIDDLQGGSVAARIAGRHGGGGPIRINELAPLVSVRLRGECLDRDLHEIGITDIPVKVSEREFLGLRKEVKGFRAVVPQLLQVIGFDRVEHLQQGDPLRGRWEPVNRVAPVHGGDRLHPVGPVVSKVLQAQKATVFLHVLHDRLRERPVIEDIPPAGGDLT